MERPTKIEVGQRWRVGDRDSKEITVTGFYAELNAWYVCSDGDPDVNYDDGSPYRHDGTCCWYPKEFFSNATFLGGPSPAVTETALVPWPEPTVGSKWDFYCNGVLQKSGEESLYALANMSTYLRPHYLPGGVIRGERREEYIPHGWDYATKQPKPGTSTQGTASVGAKSEPTPTAPARGNKESIDPSIRRAAEAQRAKGQTCGHPGPYGEPTRDTDGRALCFACYVDGDKASRRAMDTAANGLGACLIDLEKPARVSAFTERFGRVAESKRYPVSNDVDLDIPEVG